MPQYLRRQFRSPPIPSAWNSVEVTQWSVWLGFRHRRAEIYAGRGIHRLYRIVHGHHRTEIGRGEP